MHLLHALVRVAVSLAAHQPFVFAHSPFARAPGIQTGSSAGKARRVQSLYAKPFIPGFPPLRSPA